MAAAADDEIDETMGGNYYGEKWRKKVDLI